LQALFTTRTFKFQSSGGVRGPCKCRGRQYQIVADHTGLPYCTCGLLYHVIMVAKNWQEITYYRQDRAWDGVRDGDVRDKAWESRSARQFNLRHRVLTVAETWDDVGLGAGQSSRKASLARTITSILKRCRSFMMACLVLPLSSDSAPHMFFRSSTFVVPVNCLKAEGPLHRTVACRCLPFFFLPSSSHPIHFLPSRPFFPFGWCL
jgi:hypothetical protein